MITNKTFQGEAEIIVYDKQSDGSLKESFRHKQHNKILIRVLEMLLRRERVFIEEQNILTSRNNKYYYDGGRKIGIFTNQEAETFSKKQAAVLATGDPTLIADDYIKTPASDTEPANVVYKQRFLSPAIDRTFYSLGIVEFTYTWSRADNNPSDQNILTYILLNTPISQTTNQVLDINYKVFIDWEGSTTDANESLQREIERLFFGEASTNADYQIGFEKNQPIWGTIVEDPGTHLFNYWYNWNDSQRTQYFGYLPRYEDLYNLTNRYGGNYKPGFVGSFVKGWQYGGYIKHNPELPSHIGRDYINKTSNLSSVYSHSVGATKPMYDANKLANSSWQPLISDDNVTKEYPAVYAIKVSKAGGLGVGEYKIYKTGWSGWAGNRYEEAIGTPFLQFDMSLYYVNKDKDNYNVESNFDCYNHRWNYTWSYSHNEHLFVSYVRDVGVALFKLTSESFELVKRYKLSDNPNMQFFIHDIEVLPEQELIYVATEGGLFKIDTSTDTITQEHTERCMCVVTGYQNKVFAVFTNEVTDAEGVVTIEGKISSSDDYTTALPDGVNIDSSALPVWENTWRLFIDKESPDYNMVLVVGIKSKGVLHDIGGGYTRTVYILFWRNSSEYIKRQEVTCPDAYNRNRRFSDLLCFPSNNSIICDNGLWIYADQRFWKEQQQIRYLFDYNWGEDFKQDFINRGWRTREADYYSWVATSQISNDNSLYTFPNNRSQTLSEISGSRFAVSRFAEDSMVSIYSHMSAVGDIFKKYEGEGLQYKLRLLLEPNGSTITSPYFHPNSGGGTLDGWKEGINLTPSTNYWDGYHADSNRHTYFLDLDIDLETDTITGELKGSQEDYSKYSLRSYSHPDLGSLRKTVDKQIIMFPKVGTVCSRGFYMLSLFRDPDKDLKDTYIQAYSWNSTTSEWEKDNTNTGPGKPLHTATEPAVNGLSIGWQELAPDDSQDLVLDQYYTFTRTTPDNMIPVEDHTPNFDYYYWFSYRRRKEKTYQSIVPSNNIIFVPDAPDGTNPDPEWHGLANTGLLIQIYLDGEKIGLTESANTNPPAGTAYYRRGLGKFHFNTADQGKTADINYVYYLKYDDTEE